MFQLFLDVRRSGKLSLEAGLSSPAARVQANRTQNKASNSVLDALLSGHHIGDGDQLLQTAGQPRRPISGGPWPTG